MDYYLMHKDRTLAIFMLEEGVELCTINKKYADYLPLSIKKVLSFKEAYVESEESDFYNLNEEGSFLVEQWLNNREIPVTRDNKEKYLKRSSGRKFMLDVHACSLDDCYWVMREDEELIWDDVKLFNLVGIDNIINIENAGSYSAVNSTLGGQLEKFWYTEKNNSCVELRLCKKERNSNIIIVREMIASRIYKNLGIIPYCYYDFVYNRVGDIVGCSCKAFTSEDVELITAYDLLEEINCAQVDDVYERIIEQAVLYGAERSTVRHYMDVQTIVDYLITNRDRHQGNIAFLRNSETLEIIGPAPIFDSGSSRFYERELPESVLYTTVNGLYKTEMECLEHVTDFSLIDTSKLLSDEEYKEYLLLSNERNARIDDLLELYQGKVKWLKEKQHDIMKQMNIFE